MKQFVDITGAEYIASQYLTKAPLESPVFLGKPEAPTAANGNSSKQIANTEFVMNAVTELLSDVKGHVNTYADLPLNPAVGDTYIVDNDTVGTGTAEQPQYPTGYYRWDGAEWDLVNLSTDIEFYTDAEVQEIWNEIINPTPAPVTP